MWSMILQSVGRSGEASAFSRVSALRSGDYHDGRFVGVLEPMQTVAAFVPNQHSERRADGEFALFVVVGLEVAERD